MKLKTIFDLKTILLLLIVLALASACSTATPDHSEETEAQHEEDGHGEEDSHGEEDDHGEEDSHGDENSEGGHDHTAHDHNRLPNNGAVVRIASPAEGATFKVGDEILLAIELENFELTDGNHWHIYVNGSTWGMVLGGNMSDILRGLDAGEQRITVYLSVESHEELEEGDTVTIVINE